MSRERRNMSEALGSGLGLRSCVRWAAITALAVAALGLVSAERPFDSMASAEDQAPASAAPPAAPANSPTPAPAGQAIPPAAKPAENKPKAASGTPATVVDGQQVESLLGKEVQSAKGEDMGRIADIIVDKTGQTRAAVIDFGGFLGVGSRKIAVAWSAIHVGQDGKLDRVIVDIPRDELRVAPIYKEGEPVVILGRSPEPEPKNISAAPNAAHSDGTPAPAAK